MARMTFITIGTIKSWIRFSAIARCMQTMPAANVSIV
jgi:hypothetical protein